MLTMPASIAQPRRAALKPTLREGGWHGPAIHVDVAVVQPLVDAGVSGLACWHSLDHCQLQSAGLAIERALGGVGGRSYCGRWVYLPTAGKPQGILIGGMASSAVRSLPSAVGLLSVSPLARVVIALVMVGSTPVVPNRLEAVCWLRGDCVSTPRAGDWHPADGV